MEGFLKLWFNGIDRVEDKIAIFSLMSIRVETKREPDEVSQMFIR